MPYAPFPHYERTPPLCEQRRYWRGGYVVDVEWWQAGRLLLTPPPVAIIQQMTDYCEAHRTRVYRDLACPYCHERPRWDASGQIAPSSS